MLTPRELPKDKFASVGQINTRYWDEGESQVPIILIHGLGGFIEFWIDNIEALAKKNIASLQLILSVLVDLRSRRWHIQSHISLNLFEISWLPL